MFRSVRIRKFLFLAGASVSAASLYGPVARGGEILVNGSLEASAAPSSWTLENSIFGQPGVVVNATEQIGGDASEFDDGLGLYLRPFAGNVGTFAGQNLGSNSILSQVVNVSANRTYTFTGSAKWRGDGDPTTNDGFSGGVDFLFPGSPSDPDGTGTVPSPTETYFQLEFLDASNAVIGTPTRLNLKADSHTNDGQWVQHSVSSVAPANARRVRVTAAAVNMVDNSGAQDAYFDTFSLRDNTSPNTERLQNAKLDVVGAPLGFEITENRTGTDTLVGYRDFANHTDGGQQGLWLRAFAGGDAFVFQDVAAKPGGNYEFSAWSLWERGYAGGLDDAVKTTIEMQFLDSNNQILSTNLLDLKEAGQANEAGWQEYSVKGVAPAQTAKVRVRAGATGMYNSMVDPQSAFFDDFSLIETLAGIQGDYNNDGLLTAADIDLITTALGTTNATYDVNGDSQVTNDDRIGWLHSYKKTWVGDVDLDGQFNSGDLVAMFAAGKYETGAAAGYADGDFDGDGRFGTTDLVTAFADGGYEAGPRAAVAAVPEPSSMALIGLAGMALLSGIRRRVR